MYQFLQSQSVIGGAEQFDGSANAGLFLFPFSSLSKTEVINIEKLGIFGAVSTPGNYVEAYWMPQTIGDRILVGTANESALITPSGKVAVTFCPGIVPRDETGEFFNLAIFSSGFAALTVATLSGRRGAP
jgi:hypothetical protein